MTVSKKTLSEDDIGAKFITPAVIAAGWDEILQIRRQVYFTKGRIIVRGRLVTRGKAKRADYILYYNGIPIAVIEVKDNTFPVAAGMQQALDYALTLDVPFVFASNGDAFVFHDRTGQGAQLETALGPGRLPQPRRPVGEVLHLEGARPRPGGHRPATLLR
jgi:type I restriction enzyme R subunit